MAKDTLFVDTDNGPIEVVREGDNLYDAEVLALFGAEAKMLPPDFLIVSDSARVYAEDKNGDWHLVVTATELANGGRPARRNAA